MKGVRKSVITLLCAVFMALTGLAGTAQASNVAQVPLFLTQSVDPNLMFIVDDSGSMYWSFMPDGIYGLRNEDRAKSSTINRVYYNPNISYAAPIDGDGNSLGDANFTSAWFDGYASTRDSSTVDLSTSFRPTWYYAGTTTAYAGSAEPAYYYSYDEACGNVNSDACYDKVVVGVDSGPGGADERQNFANWYSYYRTRMYTARAGIGAAFTDIPDNFRLGWGRINKGSSSIDGESVRAVTQGVRQLSVPHRQGFYDWLYSVNPTGGTPLRFALDGAGRYYENATPRGPWSSTPGDAGGENYECRRGYTILMTDGYYADSFSGIGNSDDTDGSTITGQDQQGNALSDKYEAQPPFSDAYSNTLADIAMHYWKRDLNTGLGNRVPTTKRNPAFWQHMVTYTVGLGVEGTVTPPTPEEWEDLESWPDPAWPNPTSSDAAKIDDMLHAAVNSRGGFFSATEPDVFASELADTLKGIVAEARPSAASVAANSTRLSTDTFVYQARFDSSDWSGSLLAFKINLDGSIATAPAWDAADAIPSHDSRNIFTIVPDEPVGSRGRAFQWGGANGLSATQQAEIGSQAILDYIRGDTSNTAFRERDSLLGDIINSQPVYAGRQNYGYGRATSLSAAERSAYTAFRGSSAYLSRPEVVYAGANDGMLHAFRVDGTANGQELFAYVPNAVIPDLPELADPDYSHRYYVDGPPRVSDAYVGSQWRTMLVGSTGAGGKSYFGLDVTSPQTFGQVNVRWEVAHVPTHPDWRELGYAIGQAAIGRTESGNWVAIFGNGYESNSRKAQLFVVDLWTGELLKRIDTQVGSSADPNGMGPPVAIDSTGNGSIDLVYAGDLHGNLWKFDFTKNNVSGWDVAFKQGSTPKPLFEAIGPTPDSQRQPITAKPQVGLHKDGGLAVYVGTGKFFESGDEEVGTNPPVQTFYGIHDVCGSAIGSTCERVTRSDLVEQVIYHESTETFGAYTSDIRLVSQNALSTGQLGFYMDLVSPVLGREGERIVSEAVIWNDRIIFTTLIPDPDPCGAGGTSWLMEIDPFTGGRLNYSVFDLNRDGLFDSGEYVIDPITGDPVPVSGVRSNVGITRTPTPFFGSGGAVKILSGTAPGDDGENLESVMNRDPLGIGRQSWEQLR